MAFNIATDFNSKLIRASIEGSIPIDETARFMREVQDAVGQLGSCPDGHDLLADLTGYAIQIQPVVEAFQSMIADTPHRARRVVIVTQSARCACS